MKKTWPFLFLAVLSIGGWCQSNLETTRDEYEVRWSVTPPIQLHRQQALREMAPWQHFLHDHPGWMVHFNEASAMPHRAYGPGFLLPADINEFREGLLSYFTTSDDIAWTAEKSYFQGGYQFYRSRQTYQGLEVLTSKLEVRLKDGKVVMWGMDVFDVQDLSVTPVVNLEGAKYAAQMGLPSEVVSNQVVGELKVLPILHEDHYTHHLVYEVMVKTQNGIGIPQHYQCYVDAQNGTLLYRVNQVNHIHDGRCIHPAPAPAQPVMVVDVNVGASYYLTSPWDAAVSGVLPNMQVSVGGTNYFTDLNGNVSIPAVGPVSAQFSLQGPWARVYTGNTTPSFSATLNDGANSISFDDNANIKERTAYRSVQDIHDHMKFWMPTFTGMDFQLPTNIDVTGGDCNAFYDGSSINFYDLANGCNATSNIPDIAYHEYGHGINDNYYQSLGSFFMNGAIGEAYADFWAISLTNNPILGSGFYIDNQDPIRRYDIDPKVYPMDLVGEVHQDGEILMGAWWDTHLLMGADWNITMPIFLGAYAGLQAENMNGNEGQAFTDVLIDALLADDDDGDITNGTPHGNAIVQGFYMHGISLITNAVINHAPSEFVSATVPIPLEVQLDLTFPYITYLQDVVLNYKINGGQWTEVPMTDMGSDVYQAVVEAQPLATVLYYYITTHDINNNIGTVQPRGAQLALYPNLPHITLVGVSQQAIQDCDDNENWGAWSTGLPTDNATTGIWTLDTPIASYNADVAPDVAVQTGTQTTPGGEYCFFTGNALPTDGIGANDVDAGSTTLLSPTIDLSGLIHPVISYQRWYTNSPPSGANPGADWFQVMASNDDGQNWVYIENTSTSDMSWRRNAFRVEDFLTPTAQMRFKFIASDSLRPEVNLNGGSLVEAAMDDFTLYDEFVPQDVVNSDQVDSWNVFPNILSRDHSKVTISIPANELLTALSLYNSSGALLKVERKLSLEMSTLFDMGNVASGYYWLKLEGNKSTVMFPFVVMDER